MFPVDCQTVTGCGSRGSVRSSGHRLKQLGRLAATWSKCCGIFLLCTFATFSTAPPRKTWSRFFFQKNSAKTWSPDSFRFLVGEIPSSEFVSFEVSSRSWVRLDLRESKTTGKWRDGMMMVWYGLGRKVSDDINMLERDGKNKQKAHRKDISRAWKNVTLRLSILSILSTCPFFSANSRRKFKSFRHIVMTAWLHVFWRFVFALHFNFFQRFHFTCHVVLKCVVVVFLCFLKRIPFLRFRSPGTSKSTSRAAREFAPRLRSMSAWERVF